MQRISRPGRRMSAFAFSSVCDAETLVLSLISLQSPLVSVRLWISLMKAGDKHTFMAQLIQLHANPRHKFAPNCIFTSTLNVIAPFCLSTQWSVSLERAKIAWRPRVSAASLQRSAWHNLMCVVVGKCWSDANSTMSVCARKGQKFLEKVLKFFVPDVIIICLVAQAHSGPSSSALCFAVLHFCFSITSCLNS